MKTFMVIGVSLIMLVGVSLFVWLSPAREILLPSTTLSNDVLAHYFTVDVTDVEGISRGQIAFVDREAMAIQTVTLNTLVVTRGVEGTRAAFHTAGARVFVGDPAAFRARRLELIRGSR